MVKPGMNNQAKQGSNEIETLVGVSHLMTPIRKDMYLGISNVQYEDELI
jgi:hypothetical protein